MILGFVEHEAGVPDELSLEMLTMARDLGEELDVVVFGGEAPAVADELAAYGVDEVHHADDDRLDTYAPEAFAESIVQLAGELDPEAVVAPGSDRGHEVLAHAAASLDLPMVANCLEVETGDTYEITRQRWGGSLLEESRLEAGTKLLTAAEHEHPIVEADAATDPGVHGFAPDLDDSAFRVGIDRVEEADIEGVPLAEARVVVGGGRGVGSAEDFDQLEELADLLGGALGASRAAVNEGWRPHDDQIGLTGTKISADIYIPCGISGAVQHMVGAKGSDNILAINTDPEAPIIQKGDYAVVGDLHEVVPELNDALQDEVG